MLPQGELALAGGFERVAVGLGWCAKRHRLEGAARGANRGIGWSCQARPIREK